LFELTHIKSGALTREKGVTGAIMMEFVGKSFQISESAVSCKPLGGERIPDVTDSV
jgi:hypothetical protein